AAGPPEPHVAGGAGSQARLLPACRQRLLELPSHVVVYPSHYAGSVCGHGLSGNPVSSIGFERAHNPLLAVTDADAFADALLAEMPPPPAEQDRIVAANRAGSVGAAAWPATSGWACAPMHGSSRCPSRGTHSSAAWS